MWLIFLKMLRGEVEGQRGFVGGERVRVNILKMQDESEVCLNIMEGVRREGKVFFLKIFKIGGGDRILRMVGQMIFLLISKEEDWVGWCRY